jgi:hypothetical protein
MPNKNQIYIYECIDNSNLLMALTFRAGGVSTVFIIDNEYYGPEFLIEETKKLMSNGYPLISYGFPSEDDINKMWRKHYPNAAKALDLIDKGYNFIKDKTKNISLSNSNSIINNKLFLDKVDIFKQINNIKDPEKIERIKYSINSILNTKIRRKK